MPCFIELRAALRWWWENRPIKDGPYVFICLDKNQKGRDNYGQPYAYRHQFMKRICEDAGVKLFGFHAIRHLSASILYNKGYEVAVIQLILRHKSASTTERYLRSLGLERAREALEDLSQQKGEVLFFPEKGKRAEHEEKDHAQKSS